MVKGYRRARAASGQPNSGHAVALSAADLRAMSAAPVLGKKMNSNEVLQLRDQVLLVLG